MRNKQKCGICQPSSLKSRFATAESPGHSPIDKRQIHFNDKSVFGSGPEEGGWFASRERGRADDELPPSMKDCTEVGEMVLQIKHCLAPLCEFHSFTLNGFALFCWTFNEMQMMINSYIIPWPLSASAAAVAAVPVARHLAWPDTDLLIPSIPRPRRQCPSCHWF